MKVVVNKCFGGFGISPAGKAAYLERKGKQAFFYREVRESAERPSDRVYELVTEASDDGLSMFVTATENLGERIKSSELWDSGKTWDDDDVERDDPELVDMVQSLGPVANGRFAELEIVEIPDDVDWEIDEYDGLERVAEVHRTWG